MMEPESASYAKKRKFCGHCKQFVGYSTYYRHKDRFFDPHTSTWLTEELNNPWTPGHSGTVHVDLGESENCEENTHSDLTPGLDNSFFEGR